MDNLGNKNSTSNIMGTYKTLKENIMKTLSVCEVGQIVQGKSDNYYKVKLLNKPKTIIHCFSRENYNVNDLVLIIFTNYDTRANIKRALNNEETVEINTDSTKHNIDFGIIIKQI